MQKRSKTNEVISFDDPFWRVYRLMENNYDETISWLDTPNPKLGWKKPSTLMMTPEGRKELMEMFERIDKLYTYRS